MFKELISTYYEFFKYVVKKHCFPTHFDAQIDRKTVIFGYIFDKFTINVVLKKNNFFSNIDMPREFKGTSNFIRKIIKNICQIIFRAFSPCYFPSILYQSRIETSCTISEPKTKHERHHQILNSFFVMGLGSEKRGL